MPIDSATNDPTSALRRSVLKLARRLRSQRLDAPNRNSNDSPLASNALSVLAHLHLDGQQTPGGIAKAEGQQPQSLTRVFAELERQGLLVRVSDPSDKRQQLLEITRDGQLALARDMAQRDLWLGTALAKLSATERQVLIMAAELMEKMSIK